MTAANQPADSLIDTVHRLNNCFIPYMITGSVAAQMYGLNRATQDVDIVVKLSEDDARPMVEAFRPDYYIDEQMVRESARTRLLFNVISLTLGGKFDLIPLRDDEFEVEKFERRQPVEWHEFLVWVISPADLVLSKLQWARESHSEMQLSDVQQIMRLGSLMNRMTASSTGSTSVNSSDSWSVRVPLDTSAAAAAAEFAWWSALTPGQRGSWWQRRQATFTDLRLAYLKKQYPNETRQELVARITEERYRDSLPPEFLQRALEAIRNYRPGQGT